MCASEFEGMRAVRTQAIVWLMAMGMALLAAGAQAQSTADREQEQLRRLRLQIRQLQQEQASAQEAQTRADKGRAQAEQALKAAQAEAGQRQATAGRRAAALAQEAQGLRDDNAQLRQQIAQLKSQLQAQQTAATRSQDQTRAALADARAVQQALDTRHAQCRADNAALHALGTELLQRYEHKGVAEVLAAQEPFFQMARVRLENTAAQYRDKLDAARFKEPSASVDARP